MSRRRQLATSEALSAFVCSSTARVAVVKSEFSGGMALWLVQRRHSPLSHRMKGSGCTDWCPIVTHEGGADVRFEGDKVSREVGIIFRKKYSEKDH